MCKRVCVFALTALVSFSGCGGYSSTSSSGPTQNPPPTTTKSAKRGIAYDLASPADLVVLSPGASWWYNWSPNPNAGVPSDYLTKYSMDFYPMLWNGSYNAINVAYPINWTGWASTTNRFG
jgi:Glycosyl hydrolase catalytic core